jgi:lysophospholipase L1-like esterase
VYPFDGITYTNTTGWRKYIYQDLLQYSYGPVTTGFQADDASQGLNAQIAGGWHNGVSGSSGKNWLPVASGGVNYLLGFAKPAMDSQGITPQIMTIALGANGTNSSANATDCLAVLDLAAVTWPLCHVIACSRIKQAGADADVFNAAMLSGVNTRIAGGAKLHWFDWYPLITTATTDLPDGIHPSWAAYGKMGSALSSQIASWLTSGAIP